MHPGQTARIERDGREVGFLGAIHPELSKTLGLDRPVFVFELVLAEVSTGRLPKFHELSRFPEVWHCWLIATFRPVRFWTLFVKMQASGSQTSGYLMFTRVKALIHIEKALQSA
ncbi:Phenylalanine--tRNA ligase beta subunit [Pseudomonas amygdali pv. tabaci]|uniref:Phenylalanine--tRNA ligase beta subunit n=1 Tax=Pseudomonas amygdali pv. tabaci TaxID=322 RepID=A0A3M6HPY2_PSEAJ|nr:Phenylalanine--tRNA ligase beta subunit [Pseudomonas amygdali pv. tabaci]